jgi:TatA/E family protein of Tat protein translocase
VEHLKLDRVAAFVTRQYDESMNLGFSEMVFLFLLALLIFGPKKLPEIGRQIGKALNEFKRASNEFRAQIESEIANLEHEPSRQILPPVRPPEGAVSSGTVIEGSVEPAPNSSAKASDA